MKTTKKIHFTTLLIALLFGNLYTNAQSTVPGNVSSTLPEFLGWDNAGFSKDLNISNQFSGKDIKFYTETALTLRMFINSGGNVGVGDFTTAQSLLHLHQAASSTATDFQMTNAGTGSTATDGFKLNVLSNGLEEFRSFENQFYISNQRS